LSSASSDCTRRLTWVLGTSSESAALVKLPASTTRTKALIAFNLSMLGPPFMRSGRLRGPIDCPGHWNTTHADALPRSSSATDHRLQRAASVDGLSLGENSVVIG